MNNKNLVACKNCIYEMLQNNEWYACKLLPINEFDCHNGEFITVGYANIDEQNDDGLCEKFVQK